METANQEIAKLIVERCSRDKNQTSMYIEEYASLLEKYTTSCVVRSAREDVVKKAKEAFEKKV